MTIQEHIDPDGFNWGNHPREWWLECARKAGIRKNSQAVKFCAAKARGVSNTQAAREMGIKNQPNAAGYRLARANEVQRLYVILQSETGLTVGDVDEAEAMRILSQLARSSDPSVRLRACEAIARMNERKAEREAEDPNKLGSPRDTLDEIGETDPLLAWWLARTHGLKWTMPGAGLHGALAKIEQLRNEILAETASGRGDDRVGDRIEAATPTRSAAEQSEGPTQSAA
jgi:hypothetical protein